MSLLYPRLCTDKTIDRHLRLRLGPYITDLAALATRPRLGIFFERLDRLLDLRPQVCTMKTFLVHLLSARLTVPPQSINTVFRPRLLNHHSHRIRKAHGIVRDI